jgi:glyoxylase-like metal-dependent hydrolase (beta-lactamase superfamily II)
MLMYEAAVPPFMKNGFVVACERTREAVFIDPGDEVDQLLDVMDRQRFDLQHILLTHAHVDHVTGVARAKRYKDVPIHLHREDLFLYDNAEKQGAMFGLDVEQPPPVDRYYDGSAITFGDYTVAVHHTPGHCPGGVCLAISRTAATPGTAGTASPPDLFVGDTLFAGSIGRTDLPGGNYERLMRSITKVLFAFGDEAVVYSGHGKETTIGRERRTNPFVLEWMKGR